MNNKEIKAMLYDILETYAGFDGQVKGILKINEYVMNLKEDKETPIKPIQEEEPPIDRFSY